MIVIFDGYTDEPAGLGVPPYIGTYPRYVFGAIRKVLGISEEINYLTIDDVRSQNDKSALLYKADIVIAIAGVHTPGKYIAGTPISFEEIVTYFVPLKCLKFLGGPVAASGTSACGGSVIKNTELEKLKSVFDFVVSGDIELFIYSYLKSGGSAESLDVTKLRDYKLLRDFAILGAEIITQHPDFDSLLMCELESYRGCGRDSFCSFCTEPLRFGKSKFRLEKDIIDEVQALYSFGARHFRLGRQPCIFSYMSKDSVPNPESIELLFSGICKVAPELKTLHIDNANPHVIAKYPVECEKIAKTLVKYCTPGNVAAFGMESADPVVILANNLNTTPDEVLFAVRLLNKVGAVRGNNGMPMLLPGINFVFGLFGETKKTFQLNFAFLKSLLDEGLLVRRINLRQVAVFPGTRMESLGDKLVRKHHRYFTHYKYKVRTEIDRVILERLVPKGVLLTNLKFEFQDKDIAFARQSGSYPILVGIPCVINKGMFDAKVVGWGYRSITCVPYPLDINNCSKKCLEFVPGIGPKRALTIVDNRPLSKMDLEVLIDDPVVFKSLLDYIE
ncbi:MAG: radical SAM protein [DPANN group archaeon]|nr:radical SAM protein [DPANN group archaeon]